MEIVIRTLLLSPLTSVDEYWFHCLTEVPVVEPGARLDPSGVSLGEGSRPDALAIA